MCSNQNRTLLYAFLPVLRFGAIEARLAQRAGDPACHVASRFSQLGREWTVNHDWPDARQYQRDGREQMTTELAETRRGGRILDLRARRCTGGFGESALFIVRPRDDRHALARNTEAAQAARRRSR